MQLYNTWMAMVLSLSLSLLVSQSAAAVCLADPCLSGIVSDMTKELAAVKTSLDQCQLSAAHFNLALHKKTIQSSTYINPYQGQHYQLNSSFAVDGSRDSNGLTVCAHTNSKQGEWWAVDLEEVTKVGRVRITGRGDNADSRLTNFYVGLTNTSPWTTAPSVGDSSACKSNTAAYPPAGIPTNIYCDPEIAAGRYLFIKMSTAQYLTLCEVEVFYQ